MPMKPPSCTATRWPVPPWRPLTEKLIENPHGLLVVRDELPGWLAGLDRENAAKLRAFLMTGWNGKDGWTFDRIGRGHRRVPAVPSPAPWANTCGPPCAAGHRMTACTPALKPTCARGDLYPALESHLAKYRKLVSALAMAFQLADGRHGPVAFASTPRTGACICRRTPGAAMGWPSQARWIRPCGYWSG